jgi:hypothetical protein
MQNETLKKLIKNGAIWAFIVFQLVFFEVPASGGRSATAPSWTSTTCCCC